MKRWFRLVEAQAHCDVPCGIYDPVKAQQAALSVVRFLDLLAEMGDADDSLAARAKLARLTAEKEAHAAEVKAEVVVIWGDYFKAPQIEAHPQIHALTHDILRQASACKQGVDPVDGRKLVELVNDFAEVFWSTRGVETERVEVPYEPKLAIVQGKFEPSV